MNLPQLYYFRKLAEMQHYTKAAKELYITQPALSDSISALEQELGVVLFQKEGRNIKLTKYGKEFYQYVLLTLNTLERGITSVKEASGNIGGIIDVGCIPTLLGSFLPEIIGSFIEQHPRAKFNIFHGMSLEIAQGVSMGKYDIGFCSKVDEFTDLVYIPLIAQELIAVVNTQHPLASKTALTLCELKTYPLITYRDTIPIGKVVKTLLKAHGLTASFLYDDEISIGGQIAKKPLTAILARTPFLDQFSNLIHITLTDVPKDTRLVYLAYSKKNYISSAVEIFADFVIAKGLNLP